jgi:thiamine-phosphate pyrophosphorylase
MLPKLQYISQGSNPAEHLHNIELALQAGIKLVQLRLKHISEDIYIESAIKAKELCIKHNAQLIINDSPLVAKKSNADGIHLGLEDMNILDAKKISVNKIIGGTANTFEHIKQRCTEQVDYIGLGPYRFTSTKETLSPVLGIDGYKDIITKMKQISVTEPVEVPIYAIGGIELNDVESIMNTGVYGIAVSGLITNSDNKEQLVKQLNNILYANHPNL